VNLAIFSNAVPPSGAALFERTASLAPVLAMGSPSGAPLFPLFVADRAAWPETVEGAEIHSVGAFDSVLGILQARRTELVVIDYDPAAGKQRDRTAFLQIAGNLAAAAADRFQLALAISDESYLDDSDFFSGRVLSHSSRQILSRLVERCSRFLTFSSGAAERLGRRFRKPFEVLTAGSLIPQTEVSRSKARARLGFPEEGKELLLGVMGRHAALQMDLLQAGVKEALRLSPGCRVLYLGPDGDRFRERPLPVPFLDAQTPSPQDIALRLRAIDVMLLPLKEGCHPDEPGVLGSLRNGTPVVSSTPGGLIDSGFGELPDGFVIVRGNELGAFLEAIEKACEQALQKATEPIHLGLERYCAEQFSVPGVRRSLGWGGPLCDGV